MGCERRVLLAFSGGNDSCAAVGILRAQGYEPTLLTLDMTGDRSLLARARRAAEALDAPLLTIDVRASFTRRIVDYFANGYLTGETPAPCTECNSRIKWNTLRDVSIERGIGRIATGHYFRLSRQYGKVFVRRAADPAKDQSYYLWGVPQSCLERAIAPMGETLKREAGERLPAGLKSPESMGICFLRGENYREFLRRRAPKGIRPGEIVDRTGKRIGTHDGCAFYTVGQKRGLGLPPSLAVVAIDADRNRLIVGEDEELQRRCLTIRAWNIPDMERLCRYRELRVVIRGIGRNPDGFARIRPERDRLHVELEYPAWAPAPGQPVVFYEQDIVLGGGILADSR